MSGAAAGTIMLGAGPSFAQAIQPLDIAPQSLASALYEFGSKTDRQMMFSPEVAASKTTRGVSAAVDEKTALAELLDGTGLTFRRQDDVYMIVQQGGSGDPQSGSAAGDGAEVEALIVTAQKREEDIQDVPIAISAFTQESLERSQVAGGPDLMTQVPNMSFTKTNFSSYSIQIRGIGTQAISATTDPAVAVAFNNTPFVRNRFFEQEFYDLERLEVLRGPQGTLYGRNATAGVVNLISAKPKFVSEARLSADLGNYSSSRLEGMVNIPLVEDKVALRLAGAWTKRDGYAVNELTGKHIDGRDLWSTRLSLRFEPTDGISANLIWEHFQEDDDRLRSGKQLCKKHVVDHVGTLTGDAATLNRGLSQGCEPASLYSPESFQTPNGFALPYYGPTAQIGNPVFLNKDVYASTTQSRDLRSIESLVEPDYRANTDIAEIQVTVDLSDNLTLASETAYSADSLWSLQDFNRFNTAPGAWDNPPPASPPGEMTLGPNGFNQFCDPQIGCSDRLMLVDLSTEESTQFSQELRLSSDFDGPFNFSLGANYLRHDAEAKYYVFINSLTLFAVNGATGNGVNLLPYVPGVTDNSGCQIIPDTREVSQGVGPALVGELAILPDPGTSHPFSISHCIYIDPNPIGSLNDEGRNYFLSRNPYKLVSYAAFGEAYYNVTPALKLTAGLRWTVDRKTAPQIPSWLLAHRTVGPYPTAKTVFQEWREPTGRLAIDWKPDFSFTDETLLYASYAHGYKAGGANPPPPILVTYGSNVDANEVIADTFGPEAVDAYEVGTKNTILDGRLTLNLAGFYYNYRGYQISEIRNRTAVNSNYDAEVWGVELETDWRPLESLRLGFKAGYQQTRMADGSSAIDLMDRTAGHDDWVVVRPFPLVPSNCILPVYVTTAGGALHINTSAGGTSGVCVDAYYNHLDPITGLPFDPTITNYATAPQRGGGVLGSAYASYSGFDPATAPNGGRGFEKDLSGNELPNAPRYTATLTADYTIPLAGDWLVTFHGDYHYQSDSWARVFNSDPYDRIEAFSTVNMAGIFTNDDAGWKVMAYVKNVFDDDAITGAFLNSDDTGLTTNVFLTEPRLYGIRVTKDFTGGAWFGGIGHCPVQGCPITVEFGGGVSRFSGEAEIYRPNWLDLYDSGLTFPLGIQDQDLDWGDAREVKLTYAPAPDWRVSTAYRFGKTNGQARGAAYEHVDGGYQTYTVFGTPFRSYRASPDNTGISATHDSEEHTLVDFAVGKEIGIGRFGEGGESVISVGLRYADFRSTSRIGLAGTPDRYVPAELLNVKYPTAHRHGYLTSLDTERGFEGVGPSLSWDASKRLFGSDEAGWAALDWSVSGSVLFGKQTHESSEDRLGRYYHFAPGVSHGPGTPQLTTTLYDDVIPRSRTEDVTVPNLSLSLGLSYSVDRVKVSTGYSYDRFFDAIDGGYTESQTFDRTIHGPYLKLSLGFGG